MSIKLQDATDPLSLAKEMDIICGHPSEARPVIDLVRALDWQIECRFMNPQSHGFSWIDWQKKLLLNDVELNQGSVVRAQVKNSYGRLTIRLKGEGKKSSKHSEKYLLLVLICIQIDFKDAF